MVGRRAGRVAADDAGGIFAAEGNPPDVQFKVQGGRIGVGGEEAEGIDATENLCELLFVVVIATLEAFNGESPSDLIEKVGVGQDGFAGFHGDPPDSDEGCLESLGIGDGLVELVAQGLTVGPEGEHAQAHGVPTLKEQSQMIRRDAGMSPPRKIRKIPPVGVAELRGSMSHQV